MIKKKLPYIITYTVYCVQNIKISLDKYIIIEKSH